MTKFSGASSRLLVLGLVLVTLGLVLAGRWLTYHRPIQEKEAKRLAEEAAKRARFDASDERIMQPFDPVAGRFLPRIREAEAAIAARRQERKANSRPIGRGLPVPEGAATWDTVVAEFREFRMRELEIYRTRTTDTGAARAAGEAFLEAYLRQQGERVIARIDYPALRDLGNRALAAGSHDPMVRTYHAIAQRQCGMDRKICRATWNDVLRELQGTGYPKVVPYYAALDLWRTSFDNPEQRQKAGLQAILTVLQWLQEESRDPRWRRSVCERIWGLWRELSSTEKQWLATGCFLEPGIDPYIAHALAGTLYVDLAWQRRGSGWAVDVKPEQWEGFEKHLKSAAQHLQYAWNLHPELPYAPERMIPIAMANGPTEEDAYFWFLRTIEARFDDPAVYDSFAYSLTERWGGRRQWLYDFAADCLDTRRFDTYVPYAAMQTLLLVRSSELGEGKRLADDADAVRLADQFLLARNRYREEHPDQRLFEADGQSRAEVILVLQECGLEVECGPYLDEAGEKLDWNRLRRGSRPGRYLVSRSRAITPDNKDTLLAFDKKLRGRFDDSVTAAALEELAVEARQLRETARTGAASSAPGYFDHVDEILRQRQAFLAGEWVSIPVDAGLTGSEPYADEWSVTPGTEAGSGLTLSGRQGKSGHLTFRPLAGFAPPLQIEVELDVPDPGPYPPRVGIGWSRQGLGSNRERGGDLPMFALEVGEEKRWNGPVPERYDRASIWFWEGHQSSNMFLARGRPHRLAVRLWKEYCEFRIDDLWLAELLPEGLSPAGWPCVGSCWPSPYHDIAGTVRIRNFRVRRLSHPAPPEDTASPEERARFWEERIAAEPEDLVALASLTKIRFDQGRDDEVVDLATRAQRVASGVNRVRTWKGAVLASRGNYAGALEEWQAGRNEPGDDYELCWRMGEVRACAPEEALRDPREALDLARFGCGGDREIHPRAYAALAAAYAVQGKFAEAIQAQEDYLQHEKTPDPEVAARMELYRAGQPYVYPAVPPAGVKTPEAPAK